jgi:UDPglucose 6-dehydrogenase
VILSQVPPGYTRALPVPAERLYYQVETLVFGRAVERATKPERFIVGCADPRQPIAPALMTFLESFSCPILPMAYESAELAKISINFCLVASISVANTLAEICERVGADWSDIAPALKLDKRIGQGAYLTPGLGIAGGNLERDLATVLRLSAATGSEASVISAFLTNSRSRRDWVLRLIHREVLSRTANPTFAVLGLAYKENTHSTKNSPSLALIENLKPWAIRVYDPVVPATAAPHPRVTGATSAIEAAQGSDAVLIMTPWQQFRGIRPADLGAVMVGKLIVDPFRVLAPELVRAAGLSYFTLGAPGVDSMERS